MSTLAQSYVAAAAGIHVLPIAVETLGPMNESAYRFFEDLGRRICDVTGDTRKVSFIFQRLSVIIHRFNAALYRETFVPHDDLDLYPFHIWLTYMSATRHVLQAQQAN